MADIVPTVLEITKQHLQDLSEIADNDYCGGKHLYAANAHIRIVYDNLIHLMQMHDRGETSVSLQAVESLLTLVRTFQKNLDTTIEKYCLHR